MAFNLKNESLAKGARKAHFCSFFFLLLFEGYLFGYFVVNFFFNFKNVFKFLQKNLQNLYLKKVYSIQTILGLNAITMGLIVSSSYIGTT